MGGNVFERRKVDFSHNNLLNKPNGLPQILAAHINNIGFSRPKLCKFQFFYASEGYFHFIPPKP